MLRSKILPFYISALFTGICLFSSFAHPFYLSVTDLRYNTVTKKLEGSVKIFVNDLETALKKGSGGKVDLLHPADRKETTMILQKWLQSSLVCAVNGKEGTFAVLGYEVESEACWIYVESDCPSSPVNIRIENTLLCSDFPSQSNIVQCEVHGMKKSAKANCPDKTLIFSY